MKTSEKGSMCEGLVCEYLKGKNYDILARNFRTRSGEIDIIAQKGSVLAFIEVKSFPANWPIEDINLKVPYSKQYRIKTTASYFLETEAHIKYDILRFDVASVCGEQITYFKGAF